MKRIQSLPLSLRRSLCWITIRASHLKTLNRNPSVSVFRRQLCSENNNKVGDNANKSTTSAVEDTVTSTDKVSSSHNSATNQPSRSDTSSPSPPPFSSYSNSYHPGPTNVNLSSSPVQPSTSGNVDPATSAANAASAAAGPSRVWNYTTSVNNSIKDIEQSLMKRIHESNQRRFRFMFFGTLGAITWFFVVFGGTIGRKLKSMTTGLALETLEDKSIKIQTEELARAVVQTVLNDKEVTAQAASFLREASHAPETQEALLKLTLHVLKHPESLKELSLLTKNVLAALSHDPEAVKHLAVLFSAVFQDPELKQHLNIVASEICKSPEVVAAATELTSEVFREPVVQEAVNHLLVEGSSNVMKNEEISVQSRQFVAEVMGDDSLQREGGNALWNSIYHAIVPGAVRITGFSLICLSLGLGGLMLSPY
mmetsp:Transcript_6377/g.10450  ORF Transcript_6377/g.10450 Transcript_6377/m.10450 type:complete len:425 (-) Transcript_6377:1507-2781(-)